MQRPAEYFRRRSRELSSRGGKSVAAMPCNLQFTLAFAAPALLRPRNDGVRYYVKSGSTLPRVPDDAFGISGMTLLGKALKRIWYYWALARWGGGGLFLAGAFAAFCFSASAPWLGRIFLLGVAGGPSWPRRQRIAACLAAPFSSSSLSICLRWTSELGAEQRNFSCSSSSIYSRTRFKSRSDRLEAGPCGAASPSACRLRASSCSACPARASRRHPCPAARMPPGSACNQGADCGSGGKRTRLSGNAAKTIHWPLQRSRLPALQGCRSGRDNCKERGGLQACTANQDAIDLAAFENAQPRWPG